MAVQKKRATILDIATEAGVSTATVSRVLSNVDYPVSEALRHKIHEIAKRLNYRPNIFGQMLKGGVNKVVGVIVPSITNPFYAQLVSDVEKRCVAGGYAPIICSSYNSPKLEQEHLEVLLRQQVAGLLLSTINDSASFIRKLNVTPVSLVLFDQPLEGFKGSNVVFDFLGGGRMATQYLVERGHRRIVFASQTIDRASRKLIHKGYREALGECGLPVDDKLVITVTGEDESSPVKGDFSHGHRLGEEIMRMETLPDAVVAGNDILAIGMINAFRGRGIKVPEDISVIGFDDIDFSAVITPGLTTIRQSTVKTAELATGLLFKQMASAGVMQSGLALEPELVVRGTVAERTNIKKRRG